MNWQSGEVRKFDSRQRRLPEHMKPQREWNSYFEFGSSYFPNTFPNPSLFLKFKQLPTRMMIDEKHKFTHS